MSWQVKEWKTNGRFPTCSDDWNDACWVNTVAVWTERTGHFNSRAEAEAACRSTFKRIECTESTAPQQPPAMTGGWESECVGGYAFGKCLDLRHNLTVAYFPEVVVETHVERPADCPTQSRWAGNPIDPITGEKHERIELPRWSPLVEPLVLHYRSGRFARQLGSQLMGKATTWRGCRRAKVQRGWALPRPPWRAVRPLWSHRLSTRLLLGAGGGLARIERIDGSGS